VCVDGWHAAPPPADGHCVVFRRKSQKCCSPRSVPNKYTTPNASERERGCVYVYMCWSFPPPPATGLKCCSIKTLAASDHNLFGCNKTIISGVLTAYELAATYGPGIIIVHCWPAHIKQIKRTQREETPFLYCVRETIAESTRTHRRSESRGRAKLITAAIKGLCFGELFLFSPRSILRTTRQREIFPRPFFPRRSE
jgi:hypothetical protein